MTDRTARVYKLYDRRDPDQRARYVGQTVRPVRDRLRNHRSEAKLDTRGYPVHAWIREIGVENLAFEELEECAYTDRFKREKHWIAVCQTGIAAGGFNLYFGSQTCHSDETRQALRAVMTRRRADPEQQIVLKKAALNMNHVIWHVRRDKPSLDCELCTSQFTS